MKPFSAWLAMSVNGAPLQTTLETKDGALAGFKYEAFSSCEVSEWLCSAPPQRVLIVPDTEENRRKLGMEE